MERISGHYEYDPNVGQPGHRADGSLHQNLYDDDGRLSGHGSFVPDEERDDEGRDDADTSAGILIGLVIGVIVCFAVAKVAPYVRAWWLQTGKPAIKSGWDASLRKIGLRDATKQEALELPTGENTPRQTAPRKEADLPAAEATTSEPDSDDQALTEADAQIIDIDDYRDLRRQA